MSEAKKLLERYQAILNDIRGLRLRLDQAEADRQSEYDRLLRCCNITSAIGKNLVNDTGHTGDPVGNAVQRIVDLFTARATNISMQLVIKMAELERIEAIINKAGLNKEEQQYIDIRFIEGKKVWQTAQKMSYCESRAGDYKRSALAKI
jgi:hypothetical protein